jgi:hypothetical protein
MQIFLALFFLTGAFVAGLALGGAILTPGCARLFGPWQRVLWINGLALPWILLQFGSVYYQDTIAHLVGDWGAFDDASIGMRLVHWIGVAYALGFFTGGWPGRLFRGTPPHPSNGDVKSTAREDASEGEPPGSEVN